MARPGQFPFGSSKSGLMSAIPLCPHDQKRVQVVNCHGHSSTCLRLAIVTAELWEQDDNPGPIASITSTTKAAPQKQDDSNLQSTALQQCVLSYASKRSQRMVQECGRQPPAVLNLCTCACPRTIVMYLAVSNGGNSKLVQAGQPSRTAT